MTLISDHPCDDNTNGGQWDSFGNDGVGGGGTDTRILTIETDATAPKSPSNVMRCTYPAGYSSIGDAPGHVGYAYPTSMTYLYYCAWVKYSSNFFGHSTQINKIFYAKHPDDVPTAVMESEGSGNAALTPNLILQNCIVGDGHYNTPGGAAFTRGSWDLLEGLYKGNSSGTADGTLDVWLNGTHCITGTGIQYRTGAATFKVFEFYPVWGGSGGPTVPADQYIQIDHLYLSKKN